jgi:hypothetical protein
MKTEDLARPGVLALGVVGVAATALLGFAAGVAVARDPEILRRTARRVARGLESATLMAAQAREHVGDLWAQAREEAVAEVDAADFDRAAARSAQTAPAATAAAAAAAAPARTPRRRAQGARKPRRSAAAVSEAGSKKD